MFRLTRVGECDRNVFIGEYPGGSECAEDVGYREQRVPVREREAHSGSSAEAHPFTARRKRVSSVQQPTNTGIADSQRRQKYQYRVPFPISATRADITGNEYKI